MDNILETNRLVFRKLCYDDMDNLKKTLQDEVASMLMRMHLVMKKWKRGYSAS